MRIMSTHPRSAFGIGLGFKRVGFCQWALSKMFPYRRPSLLGALLVHRGAITSKPHTALHD